MAIYLVTGAEFPWNLEQLEAIHAYYLQRRWHKQVLMLGNLFEAAFTIRLAEARRKSGSVDGTRELISFAVEAFPGRPSLLELERSQASGTLDPID